MYEAFSWKDAINIGHKDDMESSTSPTLSHLPEKPHSPQHACLAGS